LCPDQCSNKFTETYKKAIMKRIIAAFDGLKYSASTRDYAIALAKGTNMHLTAVFLDDFTYTSYKVYELITKEGVSEKKLKQLAQKDADIRKKAAADMEITCRKAGIRYNVHQSIYADLLIIDSSETLTHYEETLPTRFIRDLLAEVQCPVLLVPKKYRPVKQISLLFDGGPSAVHAIRMFSYMYPVTDNIPVEVLSVKGMSRDKHLPDNNLMREFITYHFPRATFKVLKGLPEMEIVRYLHSTNKNPLVVLGAYRRGSVSRWFKASMADELMLELDAPLFIAHSK